MDSSKGNSKAKVWGGRFESGPSELMEQFSRSISTDINMWQEDIKVNQAWTKALRASGILTKDEEYYILTNLDQIKTEFYENRFEFIAQDEDIHVAIERRLTELTGDTGGKIHTGRSRNDQVVTDFRLYLKRKSNDLKIAIHELVEVIIQQAEVSIDIILPGYTHTQQGQPIRLAHYLLSAFFSLRRHFQQLENYLDRIDELPLGSGALAGTAFPIDRNSLAKELGFSRCMENSIDATGNRSFCSEISFICADITTTLSRYSHDFILWCSQEFGFIDPGEKFTTGSSMMPNKKNPDAFELVRGRSSQLVGTLTGVLMLQKGIPVTYSRDLQDDKKPIFEALKSTEDCLKVFTGAVASCRFQKDKMTSAIDSALFATDVADYLVRKNIPFRKAHHIVASAVQYSERHNSKLHKLTIDYWLKLHPAFERDVLDCFSVETSVESRSAIGGTASERIKEQLQTAKNWVGKTK